MKRTRTFKNRLIKLRKLLLADARRKKGIRFDLRCVVEDYKAREQDFNFSNYELRGADYKPEMNCGTVACAMGLAALSGQFRGLSVAPVKAGEMIDLQVNNIITDYGEAGMKIFGLTEDESTWLFMPQFYKGQVTGAKVERRVAKRIKLLLDNKADLKDRSI